ncbi:futalosine hydrolase [Flavisolibacter ginsengisoli]|jgi:futalosine hydrolase|uniref:Futalosine hydrolase n=1 Tax=Flavisolibacter ginsengisoli DSM 18119 TaxID=1121884 RepID=A0A1M5FCR7_9BACT|nr:futalosine hydrolase [Flavisolibacter ginsengisoli]SHF89269.1 futalosine hydrolase [Flavisolibacter ginsengisoli DSM 18119]
MEVLLCAATRLEIDPTIQYLASQNIKNIDILVTGVGLIAATYHITKAVYQKRPQLILQAGIAGALDTNLKLGSVVIIESETIGDLGVMEQGSFRSLFDMKFLQENDAPWTNATLLNATGILDELLLPRVKGVSINEITTLPSRIEQYKDTMGASVESMEGAALHYVGLMENIPFLQVRSLSNFVGERDKSKWQIKEAIENLNKELIPIISKFVRL